MGQIIVGSKTPGSYGIICLNPWWSVETLGPFLISLVVVPLNLPSFHFVYQLVAWQNCVPKEKKFEVLRWKQSD